MDQKGHRKKKYSVVTLVPWRAHLREQIKHQVKIKIKQGRRNADGQYEEGGEKEIAFAECLL